MSTADAQIPEASTEDKPKLSKKEQNKLDKKMKKLELQSVSLPRFH